MTFAGSSFSPSRWSPSPPPGYHQTRNHRGAAPGSAARTGELCSNQQAATRKRTCGKVAIMANKIEAKNLTRRGAGRPKGSPNKLGKAAKDAIADAAEKLGGTDRLAAWAAETPENEKAFWATIYPKLIPVQVTGEGDGPLTVVVRKFGA